MQSKFAHSLWPHKDLLLMQSWSGLVNVEALLLDHNALTGFLPSTWGSLEDLQVLSIGMALADSHHAAIICHLCHA